MAAEAAVRVTLGDKSPRLLPLIVHGLVVDEHRRRGRELPFDAQTLADLEESDEVEILSQGATLTFEDAEFRDNFDAAVRELDDDTFDAFILTELRGLTTREAADVLDTSHTTVRRRAEAARHIVRREIAA